MQAPGDPFSLHHAKIRNVNIRNIKEFKFAKMKLATSSHPQNHPKIGWNAHFEILCLFHFVCFPIFHILVKHVICGSELPGIWKIFSFHRFISKKRRILEVHRRRLNFNVKTRRLEKIERQLLLGALKYFWRHGFSWNFYGSYKGHMSSN